MGPAEAAHRPRDARGSNRAPRFRDISIVIASFAAVMPGRAQASCALPPPAIVWSYPADGATDVPTNARLFYMLSGFRSARVSVDGTPVTPPAGDGVAGLSLNLTPNARHDVKLDISGEITLGLTFTSGPGPVTPQVPDAISIDRVTASPTRDLSTTCHDVLFSSDCYDTGQNSHVVFETSLRPVVFFVTPLTGSTGSAPWTMLWPGVCGSPELYLRAQAPCQGPHRITAVWHTGEQRSVEIDCKVSSPIDPSPAGSSPPTPSSMSASSPAPPGSCAMASPPGGPGVSLAALALLFLWYRLRRAAI